MTQPSGWSAVSVVLLHIIAGPPIGGIAVFTLMLPFMLGNMPAGSLSSIPVFLVLGSYAVGTFPAAVTGLWAGTRLRRHGSYGYVEAGVIALLSGAAYVLLWALIQMTSNSAAPEIFLLLPLVAFASVASALGCRKLLAFIGVTQSVGA